MRTQRRRLLKRVELLENPRLALKAEVLAEISRQRTEGERLAAEAARRAAAVDAAAKQAEQLAGTEDDILALNTELPEEKDEARFGHCTVHPSHECGFRDGTLWCWKCGGWSVGSRRASRLNDKCGAPTKAGAEVIRRVSAGAPPRATAWNDMDDSVPPPHVNILKYPGEHVPSEVKLAKEIDVDLASHEKAGYR